MSQFRTNNPVKPPRWERPVIAVFWLYATVVVGVVAYFVGFISGWVAR